MGEDSPFDSTKGGKCDGGAKKGYIRYVNEAKKGTRKAERVWGGKKKEGVVVQTPLTRRGRGIIVLDRHRGRGAQEGLEGAGSAAGLWISKAISAPPTQI